MDPAGFDDVLAGKFGLFAVQVLAGRRNGYTLWGGDYPGGYDRVLLAGGRIVLTSTIGALARIAATESESCFALAGLGGHFAALAEAIPPDAVYLPPHACVFDFRRAAVTLASADVPGFGDVLTCVDLVTDLRHQLGLPAQADSDPLRKLYDALWSEDPVAARYAPQFTAATHWITTLIR
ncbi:MAG: hypothetical protein JWO79_2258 [Actinomycetia bacterium]|nr:hypothetical protein [Actinomycetes bacterium]MDQ1652998.1 hypothetical protein [Cryptosporangiaceae bacterium]MDQ1657628.1 hypothetical protein [Cryptosporangiaceae bacterium]